jgi:hypothetical protein
MKRISVLLLGLLAFSAACEDEAQPNPGPSNLPPVFTSTLTTANELPAPTTELTCSGTVRVQLNVTRANATSPITAATADFNATIAGCPTTTVINIAHIHEAPAGQTAGIAVNTGLVAGELTLNNGAGAFTKNGINVDPALAQRLIDNAAGFYFNIHSAANPPGIIRGQLTKIQ